MPHSHQTASPISKKWGHQLQKKQNHLGGKNIHVRKIGSDYCILLIQGTAQYPSLFAALSKKFPEDDANK